MTYQRESSGAGFVGIVLILTIVIGVFVIGPSSCTDEQGATRVLQQNGYKDVHITGFRPFMKSESDFYSTGFDAISPSGDRVTGAVTGGLLKGKTIRLD